MPDFQISQEAADGGVVIVRVSGFLDAHTFEELEEAITGNFREGRFKIVVDLSRVGYISSAGAGVFIGALSEAQENGGNIVILKPTRAVNEVFELLGLTQIFTVEDDQAAAMGAF
jgi:anti-anti-sigma factor